MTPADPTLVPDLTRRQPRRFVYVAQKVLELIHTGKLTPGDRLPPDRTLAVDFAVSRPTVREALLALELVGVVEIRHGSGVYVCNQSAQNISSQENAWFTGSTSALFEARTAVEPKIARLCAARMETSQVRRLGSNITRAQQAINKDTNYLTFIALQNDFHQLLSDGCASPLLADINAHLMSMEEHPLWALLNQHILRTREQRQKQVDEHRVIFGRIADRNGDAAADAMRDHIVGLGCAVIGTDWIA